MTPLKAALNALNELNGKAFNGQYACVGGEWGEFYEAETDENDEGISGMDGYTQQVFSLHIEPARNHGRLVSMYIVEARQFKVMRTQALVPGAKLLDFLLRARIVVTGEQSMMFEYSE